MLASSRARDEVFAAGLRPRLFGPVSAAVFSRLKGREGAAALQRVGFRSSEVEAVQQLDAESQKTLKMLAGNKTATPRDAYAFLEHTPPHLIVFLMAEASNAKALNKVRNYINKWRPLRHALAGAGMELEALGVARGPKFDRILEDLFILQLNGKGRTPEDRTKLLRKLAGIKDEPKKKEEKKKSDDKLKKRLMGKDSKGTSAPAGEAVRPSSGKQAAGSSAPAAASGSQQKGKPAVEGKAGPAPSRAASKKPAELNKKRPARLLQTARIKRGAAPLDNSSTAGYNHPAWKHRPSFICICTPTTVFSTALAKRVNLLPKRRGAACPLWPLPTTEISSPPSSSTTRQPRMA